MAGTDIEHLNCLLRFTCGKDGCGAKELNEVQYPEVRKFLADPDLGYEDYKRCQ